MKKILCTFCCCLLAAAGFSQNNTAAGYAAHITGANLKKHLSVIADSAMEGRETGTPGQVKAAAYIEDQFKAIGLKPPQILAGYQQYYPLFIDSVNITASELFIGDEKLIYGEQYFVAVTKTSTKKITASSFVFAGYGISDSLYDDYKGLDVAGKVVVIFMGEPKVDGKYLVSGTERFSKYTYPGLSAKIKTATEKKAVAVMVINPAMPLLTGSVVNTNTRSNIYFPGAEKSEKANYLVVPHTVLKKYFSAWFPDSLIKSAKKMAAFTPASLSETAIPFSFNFKKGRDIIRASNVIGIIEGTDKKDEYVFLTAHYDHLGRKGDKIYYGADDDGSGTCAVITMAEAFAKAKAEGKGPRRTMVFMTVSGEEKGLWGSEYYSDNPIFPLHKTTVDLNTDMVGRVDTERKTSDSLNYLYVIGHDKLSSELQAINEGANQKSARLVLDYKFDDPNDKERIYYRSDHYNFARKGVPVLFFYDGMLKADYHKTTDTVDKINWELYAKRVQMIFHTAWEMANRDKMLKRDLPLPAEDEE